MLLKRPINTCTIYFFSVLDAIHLFPKIINSFILISFFSLFFSRLSRDVDQVHDMMDDIAEQQDVANEITNAISNPVAFGNFNYMTHTHTFGVISFVSSSPFLNLIATALFSIFGDFFLCSFVYASRSRLR